MLRKFVKEVYELVKRLRKIHWGVFANENLIHLIEVCSYYFLELLRFAFI
jgi:hypothetical protein